MELLALARVLWRCRIAVAVAGVVALGLGLLVATGPSTRVGVASLPVMLDTRDSQTVTAAPLGLETLQLRTILLADLMAADPIRQRIAEDMGISGGSLLIVSPGLAVPEVSNPLPDHALEAAAAVAEPYQLSIQANTRVPILAISASAPTRADAAKLAAAAAGALKAETSASASAEDGFVVEEVGPVRARTVVDGPRRGVVAVLVVGVFGLACVCITLVGLLSGTHRGRVARRRRPVPT